MFTPETPVASAILCIALAAIGMLYGILLQKYRIFPYELLRECYYFVKYRLGINIDNKPPVYGPYSIGILSGTEPFALKEGFILNPVLTGKDVSDIYADFVADPFLVVYGNKYFMFFEALNRKTRNGVIAYAESTDLRSWKYRKVVLQESFHLSYPHVFQWQNDYYMLPESSADQSVRLYKANRFPDKWEFAGRLLADYPHNDPTIFRYHDQWWLFTNGADNLFLHYSNELCTGWKPHPMNPIVKRDPRRSRPAGRVVTINDRLYRFSQDSTNYYGEQVFAFEITDLTESSYAERELSDGPVVGKTGSGWNAVGMHHLDLHHIDGRWIGVVDGASR